MDTHKRSVLVVSAKSPSTEAMKKMYNRAIPAGGVTIDFSANVANIRVLSISNGFVNILSTASIVFVPASYAESRLLIVDPNLDTVDFAFTRAGTISTTSTNKQGIITDVSYNLMTNSNVGTTQTITLIGAGVYNLSFKGTGSITLTGVGSGVFNGTGLTTRVNFSVTVTTGSLTLTIAGTVTETQLSLGSTIKDYLRTTNRLNIPKLDYSLSLLKPSLLMEQTRTNQAIRSDDMVNAGWAKSNVTATANTNMNCFGTNKSNYITDTAVSNFHVISVTTTLVTGTIYTMSFYIKKASDTWMQVAGGATGFGPDVWVNFNFDTGLFGNSGVGGTYTKKQLTNGYWLITITATSISSSLTASPVLVGTNNTDSAGRAPVYVGTLRNYVDCAAVQSEAGNNATTYIPTVATSVARAGDASFADISATSLLNSTNFTLYVEGFLFDGVEGNMSVGLTTVSASGLNGTDGIGLYGGMRIAGRNASTTVIFGTAMANNSAYKCIIQRNGTTINFFRNGVLLDTRTFRVFAYPFLVINNGGSTFTVDKLVLYPTTLSDAQCITLTT